MLRIRIVVAWMLLGLTALNVEAAVVCRKKNGAVFVRDSCRKKEAVVDLAQLGAVGPKGDKGDPGSARAYACSESADETAVSLCPGRDVKGISNVVANIQYAGFTCFVLDPSIDADAAVVVATLAGGVFAGGKINTIIAAFGASNYNGCPANSVVVLTARHTNTGTALGLEYTILPLNVAVM